MNKKPRITQIKNNMLKRILADSFRHSESPEFSADPEVSERLRSTGDEAPGAIGIGPGALAAEANTEDAVTVYLGTYKGDSIPWRVIGYDGNGAVRDSSGCLTLFSEEFLGECWFGKDVSNGNQGLYNGSRLEERLGDIFGKGFSETEQNAVKTRTLKGYLLPGEAWLEWDPDGVYADTKYVDAKLWPLSLYEVATSYEEINWSNPNPNPVDPELKKSPESETPDRYWLRTTYKSKHTEFPHTVDREGNISFALAYPDTNQVPDGIPLGIRPAFWVDLSSILLISEAEGGKTVQTEGKMEKLEKKNETGEWKLTLLDADRKGFSVRETGVAACPGGTVSFTVKGAGEVRDDEYVSVLLCGETGDPVCYGSVKSSGAEEGRVTFTLPEDLSNGEYELKVFSERKNGDKKTDYASPFRKVSLKVTEAENIPPAMAGSEILAVDMNTIYAPTVYVGADEAKPIPWRVIGYEGKGAAADSERLTLFSGCFLGWTQFDNAMAGKRYEDSSLQKAMDAASGNILSEIEGRAVNIRTLEGGSYWEDYKSDCVDGPDVKAVFWPLSAWEAGEDEENPDPVDKEILRSNFPSASPKEGEPVRFWLRTPADNVFTGEYLWTVNDSGGFDGCFHDVLAGIRPAFWLKLSDILLISEAEEGKTEKKGTLEKIGKNQNGEWKLTLKDSDRTDFKVTDSEAEAEAGGSVTLQIEGASTGESEYVSALLKSTDGKILAYGSVPSPDGGKGQVTFALPRDLTAGNYLLQVFSERKNGKQRTDQASDFVDVKLTITPPPEKKAVTGVKLSAPKEEIRPGETLNLSWEISPADADDKNVSFRSSSPETASVDENGKVTGLKDGTAVITVKTNDGGFEASCIISVKTPKDPTNPMDPDDPRILIDKTVKTEYMLLPGETQRLRLNDQNRHVCDVAWNIEKAEPKGCITLKNGVVTAKEMKKGVMEASATVKASYCGQEIVFHITVNGKQPDITEDKKNPLKSPKTLKTEVISKDSKKMLPKVSVSIPKSFRNPDYSLTGTVVSGGALASGNAAVCTVGTPEYNKEEREKASKAVFTITPVDVGAVWIRWSMKDEKDSVLSEALTRVIVKKPLTSLSIVEFDASGNTKPLSELKLSTGEGRRLAVLETEGNTDTRALSFSVKGKGIRVSKSGFVTAVIPGSTATVTVKSGKVSTSVKVTAEPREGAYLTLNKTSVNGKIPKTGAKPKTVKLKVKMSEKRAEVPAVSWSVKDGPKNGITAENGVVTIESTAQPGCYEIVGTPPEGSGLNTVVCELILVP